MAEPKGSAKKRPDVNGVVNTGTCPSHICRLPILWMFGWDTSEKRTVMQICHQTQTDLSVFAVRQGQDVKMPNITEWSSGSSPVS